LLDLNKKRIDLMSYQNGPSAFVDEIFHNVTKAIDGKAAITIRTDVANILFDPKNYIIDLNVSSVVVFDSIERFEETFPYIFWQPNLNTERLIHTIYIRGKEVQFEKLRSFVVSLENTTLNHWYLFTNFLFDDDNYVRLERVTTFDPNDWRMKYLKEINRLDKKTGKWESNNFGIRKITNFNSCSLYFGIATPYATYFNSRGQVLGHAHDVLTYLSRKLNYTVQYTKTDDPRSDLQLHISYWISVSKPYIFDEAFFFVPVGEQYSSYEKLFLPFWWDVWLAIGLTLMIGLAAIAVVELCNYQEFVFGTGVTTPTLNLAIAFFGGGQTILPTRNFARFLLAMFILWSLVIRTCYQGEYYNYLQMDARKSTIQTIDEIIAGNLTIYADDSIEKNLGYMEAFKK